MSKPSKHQPTEPVVESTSDIDAQHNTALTPGSPAQYMVAPEPTLPDGIEKGSHLYMAMRAHGARNLAELQRIQAQQRADASDEGQIVPIGQMAADLDSLNKELQEMNAVLDDLKPKVEKANKKIAQCFERKCQLEQAITDALKVPETVSNQQYLEGQKKQRIEQFAGAIRAKQAIVDAGVDHFVKIDQLKLGVSPLDKAIEQQNLAQLRLASEQAMKG